jgi:hypothetical protein
MDWVSPMTAFAAGRRLLRYHSDNSFTVNPILLQILILKDRWFLHLYFGFIPASEASGSPSVGHYGVSAK